MGMHVVWRDDKIWMSSDCCVTSNRCGCFCFEVESRWKTSNCCVIWHLFAFKFLQCNFNAIYSPLVYTQTQFLTQQIDLNTLCFRTWKSVGSRMWTKETRKLFPCKTATDLLVIVNCSARGLVVKIIANLFKFDDWQNSIITILTMGSRQFVGARLCSGEVLRAALWLDILLLLLRGRQNFICDGCGYWIWLYLQLYSCWCGCRIQKLDAHTTGTAKMSTTLPPKFLP